MNARIPEDALPPTLDPQALQAFVDAKWDNEIIPALTDYIAIPAKSPAFDADWEKNAFIERVVRDAAQWVEAQKVSGLKLEVVRLPGRTPVIFFDAPATRSDNGDTVLLYGHLDKQPEFSGWRAGLGPWTPKYEDGKLYGRGGADDGRVGRMRLQGYLEGPMKIPTNEAERNKLRRKAAATGVDAAYSEFELQSRPDDDGAGYLPGEEDAGE